jgi:hypothetical protein
MRVLRKDAWHSASCSKLVAVVKTGDPTENADANVSTLGGTASLMTRSTGTV